MSAVALTEGSQGKEAAPLVDASASNDSEPTRPSFEPGIYYDIPETDYHRSHGISKSGLDKFSRSPAHFKRGVRKETKALAMGSMIDVAILSPDDFPKLYVVGPEGVSKNSNAWKEPKKEYAANGVTMVDAEQHRNACDIRDAVLGHPTAGDLLSGGKPQVSAYWIDEQTGILCKGRADYDREDISAILDLKSTEDARPDKFSKSIATYGYHRQGGMYTDGFAALKSQRDYFILIAVEKDSPFGVKVYEIDDVAMQQGRNEIRVLLDQYAECKRNDDWPGYSQHLESIGLPFWALDSELRESK